MAMSQDRRDLFTPVRHLFVQPFFHVWRALGARKMGRCDKPFATWAFVLSDAVCAIHKVWSMASQNTVLWPWSRSSVPHPSISVEPCGLRIVFFKRFLHISEPSRPMLRFRLQLHKLLGSLDLFDQ